MRAPESTLANIPSGPISRPEQITAPTACAGQDPAARLAAAIKLCKLAAPEIATEASDERDWRIRRTSLKLHTAGSRRPCKARPAPGR